jgi:hypothetical protein
MTQKSSELLIESNVSLFEKLEMLVQHSLIDIGFPTKFIAPFDLSQIGGKNHTNNVLLIIQMLVQNLSYHKTSFGKPVVDKEKVVPLRRRKLLKSRKNTLLEEQSTTIVIEKV